MAALILDLSAKFSEWSVVCSGRFTPGRDSPVPSQEGLAGRPRAGLGIVEKKNIVHFREPNRNISDVLTVRIV
jgi:hypothetical protein